MRLAVVLVNDDRHFRRTLVSKVIEIDHGAMTVYDGDYDDCLRKSGREAHGGCEGGANEHSLRRDRKAQLLDSRGYSDLLGSAGWTDSGGRMMTLPQKGEFP